MWLAGCYHMQRARARYDQLCCKAAWLFARESTRVLEQARERELRDTQRHGEALYASAYLICGKQPCVVHFHIVKTSAGLRLTDFFFNRAQNLISGTAFAREIALETVAKQHGMRKMLEMPCQGRGFYVLFAVSSINLLNVLLVLSPAAP